MTSRERGLLGFLPKPKVEMPVLEVPPTLFARPLSPSPAPASTYFWKKQRASVVWAWHSPWGRGGGGAPEGEGKLSVRGEWEGQEETGGSEIWQGQASLLVKTTLNQRC